MQRADKVNILLNHNWDKKIGDTSSNLKLKEDVIGLRAHAELTDKEVIKLAKENKLRGWSFDMVKPTVTRAEQENGLPIRTVTDFDINEVSLISNMKPWYNSTTVETRADGETVKELRAEEFDTEVINYLNQNKNKQELKKMIQKLGGLSKEEK